MTPESQALKLVMDNPAFSVGFGSHERAAAVIAAALREAEARGAAAGREVCAARLEEAASEADRGSVLLSHHALRGLAAGLRACGPSNSEGL